MTELPPSRWVDLDGPVHYVDYGGPDDGPLLVCVHGLGGSLVNWSAVGPALARHAHVLALDLVGFGRSRGSGRSTSVPANVRVLHRFLTEVARRPVILVGNSMGGLICALQAAEAPETVTGLALLDPALPPDIRSGVDPMTAAMFAAYLLPGVGSSVLSRRRRTRSTEQLAVDVLRLCCADASRVPQEIIAQHVALATERAGYDNVDAEMFAATRSLMWVLARRKRLGAALRSIRVPVLLLHGDRDRLVSVGSARRAADANPSWRFEVAHGLGHVPQLEDPAWTVSTILDWLGNEGAQAAQAAGGQIAA